MKAINTCLKKEVVLLGANSKFGRMSSLLLKQNPTFNRLTLYDDNVIKTCNDIEYINRSCNVKFFYGKESLREAIKTGDIIIIGDEWINGTTAESMFFAKAPMITDYLRHIACYNSNAIIVVATSPVNVVLPFVAETLKNLGYRNERKIIGLTNVENMKARCILAAHLRISPRSIDFPVIGGSSPETRVPLLSKICPSFQLKKLDKKPTNKKFLRRWVKEPRNDRTNLAKLLSKNLYNEQLLKRITSAVKTSETKLNKEIGRQESLTRAYAASILVESIISALNGEEVIETVLSYQNVLKGTDFFSLPALIGKEGIKDHISFSNISAYEKNLISHAIKCMAADTEVAKMYSEKIMKNTTNIVPPSKLSSLQKGNIESVNKASINLFPSLHRIENLGDKVQAQETDKPSEFTKAKTNLLSCQENCSNNDLNISWSTKENSASPKKIITVGRNEATNMTPWMSTSSRSKKNNFKESVGMERPYDVTSPLANNHIKEKQPSVENSARQTGPKEKNISIIPQDLNNQFSMTFSSLMKLSNNSMVTNVFKGSNNNVNNKLNLIDQQLDVTSHKEPSNKQSSENISKNIIDIQKSKNSNRENVSKYLQKKKLSSDFKSMRKHHAMPLALSFINKLDRISKAKNIDKVIDTKLIKVSNSTNQNKLGDMSFKEMPEKYTPRFISETREIPASNQDIKKTTGLQEKTILLKNKNIKEWNNVAEKESSKNLEFKGLSSTTLPKNNLSSISEVTDNKIAEKAYNICNDLDKEEYGNKPSHLVGNHEFVSLNFNRKNKAKDLQKKKLCDNKQEDTAEKKSPTTQDFNNLTEDSMSKAISEAFGPNISKAPKSGKVLENTVNSSNNKSSIDSKPSRTIPCKFALNPDCKNDTRDLRKKISRDMVSSKDQCKEKNFVSQCFNNPVTLTSSYRNNLENTTSKNTLKVVDTNISNVSKDIDKKVPKDITAKNFDGSSTGSKLTCARLKNTSSTHEFTASNSNCKIDTIQEKKSFSSKDMKQDVDRKVSFPQNFNYVMSLSPASDLTEISTVKDVSDVNSAAIINLTKGNDKKFTGDSTSRDLFPPKNSKIKCFSEIGHAKICNIPKSIDKKIIEDRPSHSNLVDSKPTSTACTNKLDVTVPCPGVVDGSVPLSVNLHSKNKLSKNQPMNTISENTSFINSGKNNFNTVKRYHNQALFSSMKSNSYNNAKILSSHSSKEPKALLSPHNDFIRTISLSESTSTLSVKNDLKSNNSRSILSTDEKPEPDGMSTNIPLLFGKVPNEFPKDKSNFTRARENINMRLKQTLMSQLHSVSGPRSLWSRKSDRGLLQSVNKSYFLEDRRREYSSISKNDEPSEKIHENSKLFVENRNEAATNAADQGPESSNNKNVWTSKSYSEQVNLSEGDQRRECSLNFKTDITSNGNLKSQDSTNAVIKASVSSNDKNVCSSKSYCRPGDMEEGNRRKEYSSNSKTNIDSKKIDGNSNFENLTNAAIKASVSSNDKNVCSSKSYCRPGDMEEGNRRKEYSSISKTNIDSKKIDGNSNFENLTKAAIKASVSSNDKNVWSSKSYCRPGDMEEGNQRKEYSSNSKTNIASKMIDGNSKSFVEKPKEDSTNAAIKASESSNKKYVWSSKSYCRPGDMEEGNRRKECSSISKTNIDSKHIDGNSKSFVEKPKTDSTNAAIKASESSIKKNVRSSKSYCRTGDMEESNQRKEYSSNSKTNITSKNIDGNSKSFVEKPKEDSTNAAIKASESSNKKNVWSSKAGRQVNIRENGSSNLSSQNTDKYIQKFTDVSNEGFKQGENSDCKPETARGNETSYKPENKSEQVNIHRPILEKVKTFENIIHENMVLKKKDSILSAIKQSSFKDHAFKYEAANRSREDNSNSVTDIALKKIEGNLKSVENHDEDTTNTVIKNNISSDIGTQKKKVWSSKSYCEQVNINDNDNNLCQFDVPKPSNPNLNPQNYVKTNQRFTNVSKKEQNPGHKLENAREREAFHNLASKSLGVNVHWQKSFKDTVKTFESLIHENMLAKQKNSLCSVIKQSSFKDSEVLFSEVNKQYCLNNTGLKSKSEQKKSLGLQKFHLLSGKVIANPEPIMKDEDWKKNYFKKKDNKTKMNPYQVRQERSKESVKIVPKNVMENRFKPREKQANNQANANNCNHSSNNSQLLCSKNESVSQSFMNSLSKQMTKIQGSAFESQNSFNSQCQLGFHPREEVLNTETINNVENNRGSTKNYHVTNDRTVNPNT